MKKILSICLAVIIALSAMVLTAYASDTKTGALLEEIKSTKSYYVDFGDVFYEEEGSPFKDVKCYVKVYENDDGSKNIKFAATAKLWFFNVKLLVSDGKLTAYLPLISIDFGGIFGSDYNVNFNNFLHEVIEFVDSFDSSLVECMKLKSAGEVDTVEYGKVYVEEFVPDIRKVIDYADEMGVISIPEGTKLDTMTEAELVALIKSFGEKGENVLRMFESNATFYYDGENLVSYKVTLYDAANDNAVFNAEDLMIKKAEAIGSNVPDSAFDKPFVLFNATGIIKAIFGMLIGQFLS